MSAERVHRSASLAAGIACWLAAACGKEQPVPAAAVSTEMRVRTAQEVAAELAQSRGPWVVNLWATWCGPCMDELPGFADAARRHPKVRFLGLSADWTAELRPTQAEDQAVVRGRWQDLQMPYATDYLSDHNLEDLIPALSLPDAVLPITLVYRDGQRVSLHSGELQPEEIERIAAGLDG